MDGGAKLELGVRVRCQGDVGVGGEMMAVGLGMKLSDGVGDG